MLWYFNSHIRLWSSNMSMGMFLSHNWHFDFSVCLWERCLRKLVVNTILPHSKQWALAPSLRYRHLLAARRPFFISFLSFLACLMASEDISVNLTEYQNFFTKTAPIFSKLIYVFTLIQSEQWTVLLWKGWQFSSEQIVAWTIVFMIIIL